MLTNEEITQENLSYLCSSAISEEAQLKEPEENFAAEMILLENIKTENIEEDAIDSFENEFAYEVRLTFCLNLMF